MTAQTNFKIDDKWNSSRIIYQGLTLAMAMSVADAAVILPLIVHYFSKSDFMVGLLASFLRGGAILMQLYTAFYAQSYSRVMPKIRVVFIFRFLSWLSLGISILVFGKTMPYLTLGLFSVGMFAFSFSAGFGNVYYQELMGKAFSRSYRGRVVSRRQFWAGLASLVSVLGISGYILEHYPKPQSFAYLFLISSIFLGSGFVYFLSFREDEKHNVSPRESSYRLFVKNSLGLLINDKALQHIVITRLLSYSALLVLPFVVLEAQKYNLLTGKTIALLAGIQMVGGMLSNLLWAQLSKKNKDREILIISGIMTVLSLLIPLFWHSLWMYGVVFFFGGR